MTPRSLAGIPLYGARARAGGPPGLFSRSGAWIGLALGIWLPLCLTAAAQAPSPVVFNEIMYHPTDDRDDLQFVELLNVGQRPVDLSGWSFARGVQYVFPAGTQVAPEGFLLICKDPEAFAAVYGSSERVLGPLVGKLSHKGERLELVDRAGRLVAGVKYEDRDPWPMGADGYGSSLERICPAGDGGVAEGWASSVPATNGIAGGTPGRRNSCYSAVPLPVVDQVHFDKALRTNVFEVRARVTDTVGVETVVLEWCRGPGRSQGEWDRVPMRLDTGDSRRGSYAAEITAPVEGKWLRFRIRARSGSGGERVLPGRNEPRTAFSVPVVSIPNDARVPFLEVWGAGQVQRLYRGPYARRPARAENAPPIEPQVPWAGTVLYHPVGGGDVRLFDYVQVRPRNGGFKVHFHSDQPLLEMTGINLLFEGPPRWILSECLAYDLYRKAGVPAPDSFPVRLWVEGQPRGYHLLVEQPNRNFLRRHGRDEDGDLYKLLWYGRGIEGQHEKKTNPRTGHGDLVELIGRLNQRSGSAQWELIEKEYNVEELASYYAVNMCIQNWDGFFNNYFAYHDLRPGGKWEVFPWDEDKTWGDYDGASARYDWYAMPLTLGMNGSDPARSWFGGGPFGGAAWWRPPGHFSGPLLANPEFRRRFLARLREICETVFTPERMGPAVNSLSHRLEGEVAMRARLQGREVAEAVREFQDHIESFHRQIANRRKFILRELEAGR